ncbi:hypothetical protein L6R52_06235 [Myxococcota bacterium]|nr:hypothetical protein [Myxococcota bacterium]
MARSEGVEGTEAQPRKKPKRVRTNVTAVMDTIADVEHVDALALRLGVARAEVAKAFIRAGLAKNPVTEAELQAVRNRGEEAPVKRPAAEADADGKLIVMMVEKKRRWRDSNPR